MRSAISPRLATSSRCIARTLVGNSCLKALRCAVFAVKGLVVIGVVCCAFVGATPARAVTRLVVTGKGWGHGVGMSQWGAYGYARHGWSYTRLLRHYYPGTPLARTDARTGRVLLSEGRPHTTAGCAAPLAVVDGPGRPRPRPAGLSGIAP